MGLQRAVLRILGRRLVVWRLGVWKLLGVVCFEVVGWAWELSLLSFSLIEYGARSSTTVHSTTTLQVKYEHSASPSAHDFTLLIYMQLCLSKHLMIFSNHGWSFFRQNLSTTLPPSTHYLHRSSWHDRIVSSCNCDARKSDAWWYSRGRA